LDRSGNLWFGSRELGIVSYNPGKQEEKEPEFTIINRANGLPREDITAIYEDREGSFWFGTNGGGVYQYRGRCLEQFGIREGLPDEVIWAIYEDKKGSFWFGSESGLTKVANIDDKQTSGRLNAMTRRNGAAETVLSILKKVVTENFGWRFTEPVYVYSAH